MDRKNVIEFLDQYEILEKSCQIIDEQMFELAGLLREVNREESIGSPENVTRRVDKYRERLKGELRKLTSRRKLLAHRINLIESIVNALPKEERAVIKRFFLSGEKHAAEELMEELEFEKTQIYRIRTRALDKLGKIIENLPLSECADCET